MVACGARAIMAERARLVPFAQGRALETGVGGGLNLPFYDRRPVKRLDAVDPSPALLARAGRRRLLESLRRRLRLRIAKDLSFDAGAFDAVVASFTLRSVAAPEAALAKAQRVLGPGGRLLFCAHGLARDPDAARRRRRLEPIWRPVAGGWRLTRSPGGAMAAAGFASGRLERRSRRAAPRFAGWCARGETLWR
jgi:SAM-dependent methyltransferase